MEHSELIQREIDEMNRHKWIESEKAGRDVGDMACCDWAEQHGLAFVAQLTRGRGAGTPQRRIA